MREQNAPKWGTCGGCRWRGKPSNREMWVCCRHPRQLYPASAEPEHYCAFPLTHDNDTCGEWEPPEGKVCGNCAAWTLHDRGGVCESAALYDVTGTDGDAKLSRFMSSRDGHTCPAWRWNGGE